MTNFDEMSVEQLRQLVETLIAKAAKLGPLQIQFSFQPSLFLNS